MRSFLFVAIILSFTAAIAAADSVLIMKEDTAYKKALVREMVDRLEDNGAEVTVVDHRRSNIDEINPNDYDAVFITNSGAQAMVRPEVMAWLDANSSRDENVILHTTQINDWDPPVKVDSVTSASQRSNIRGLVDDIVGRIELFF